VLREIRAVLNSGLMKAKLILDFRFWILDFSDISARKLVYNEISAGNFI
jgi:hypothetical protein